MAPAVVPVAGLVQTAGQAADAPEVASSIGHVHPLLMSSCSSWEANADGALTADVRSRPPGAMHTTGRLCRQPVCGRPRRLAAPRARH